MVVVEHSLILPDYRLLLAPVVAVVVAAAAVAAAVVVADHHKLDNLHNLRRAMVEVEPIRSAVLEQR